MDRREFIKVSAITGASAALASCGNPEHELIRFVPEETFVPGVAVWKPSLCTLCPAGCGVVVRVMEGEAEVVRDGRAGLIRMGLAKKIEGNPAHPVSQGKVCPRGQALVQTVYHPDRVRYPLRRIGARGFGQFRAISWDQALDELTSRLRELESTGQQRTLACLTRRLRGARREIVEQFLGAFGAPPPITVELFSDEVLRRANALSFGVARLPTFDLARSRYVISFGADFLGTWNSPVAQNAAYGAMRQGRAGERGRFVQVECRMSQTGANADEWIPIRPGTDGALALGLAHAILNEGLVPAVTAPAGATQSSPSAPPSWLPPSRPPKPWRRWLGGRSADWDDALPDYTPDAVEKITGVEAARVVRLARQLATSRPAVAIVGGAPLAHTNGLFTALAVNALNALLGSVEAPGGFFFTPDAHVAGTFQGPPSAPPRSVRAFADQVISKAAPVRVLMVQDANPVFASPPGWRVPEALERIPFIVSFGSFLDETSVWADLVLPDHAPLETWQDEEPESGTSVETVSLAPPAVRPLHDTRATPDVLLDIAHRIGGELDRALPWQTFDEMIRARFDRLAMERGVKGEAEKDELWKRVQSQGGWWPALSLVDGRDTRESPTPAAAGAGAVARTQSSGRTVSRPYKYDAPQFDADQNVYRFHLLPYASQLWLDGSLSHLPWLQEIPDALSTAMWGSWAEVNPRTAERLDLKQGDLIEVSSLHGRVEVPVLISLGVAPDVIAMPVGQGHEHFTRYASGRGANPVSLLAPLVEPETGTLAWAATRVRVRRIGEGRLALFAGGLRERPHEHEPR